MAVLYAGTAPAPPLNAYVGLIGPQAEAWVLIERVDEAPRLRRLAWEAATGRLSADAADAAWRDWERGRTFSPHGDLRWERLPRGGVRWALIADGALDGQWPAPDVATDLPEPPMFNEVLYLWGVYVPEKGGWIDQRTPRILQYPVADLTPGCRVRLATKTYVTHGLEQRTVNIETRVVRFCGLRKE